MRPEPLHILLADDDNDDCLLFEEALKELRLSTHLTIVNDGEQLMRYLNKKMSPVPFVLFLDLNIPRKNGIECLQEIKANQELSHLHVIIYSTSAELDMVNLLYRNEAQYYIRKPSEFSQLKKVINHALTMIKKKNVAKPEKENFVITGDL
jgi:DNA-binding NtrC family response regulator